MCWVVRSFFALALTGIDLPYLARITSKLSPQKKRSSSWNFVSSLFLCVAIRSQPSSRAAERVCCYNRDPLVSCYIPSCLYTHDVCYDYRRVRVARLRRCISPFVCFFRWRLRTPPCFLDRIRSPAPPPRSTAAVATLFTNLTAARKLSPIVFFRSSSAWRR